ncbi:MAG: hypothetical protein H0Z28_07735 [Archaeoglobus sp.]|nr:hypothetical protein [Archaeoglobus sp.]
MSRDLHQEILEIKEIKRMLEEEGDTKEVRKAFWRFVGRMKRGKLQPEGEDEKIIEEITEIRERLFKKGVILSTAKGATLFPACFVISMIAFVWLNEYVQNLSFPISYILLFLSEMFVIYFGFLTGRLLGGFFSGIKFDGFFRYSPLEFGVKVNYKSYLQASQWKRVTLYGTTIFFQAIVMLVLILIVYQYNPQAIPIPLAFLFIWLIGSIIIHKKAKTGELHRFLRELKIASERSL